MNETHETNNDLIENVLLVVFEEVGNDSEALEGDAVASLRIGVDQLRKRHEEPRLDHVDLILL